MPSCLLNKGLAPACFCALLIATAVGAVARQPAVINGRDEVTALTPADYYRLAREARQFVGAGKYDQAVGLLETLVRANPADGNNWLMLGSARFALRRYREAIGPYEKTLELGFFDAAQGAYQIARCHALLGDKENSLRWLERALQSGYRHKGRIERDEQLKSLRTDPRFLRLLGRAETAAAGRNAGWRGDLDYLVSEVRRVHGRYRREPPPAEFARAADETRRAIPRLADEEIVVRFQSLLASLGDGHTLAYPFGMRLGALKRLPVSFYFFSDGLYVIDAPERLRALIGRKVLKIGARDAADLLKGLEQFVSRDNPMGVKWAGPVYLTFTDYLKALGATGDRERVTLLLEADRGARAEEVVISPLPGPVDPEQINVKLIPAKVKDAPPPPAYLRRMAENYWFEKLPDGKTVYLQFNQVQNQAGESLESFALRLRGFLAENGIANLIVDVRHNNGGEATLLRELYRTMVNFEITRPDARVYVLVGRNTFSAAQQFISYLDHMTGAVFAGEPSGSKPNRAGDESRFVLPYSGVQGVVASGYYQAAAKDDRVWIAPDIPVELSSADYFNGRDPVLDAILEEIKRGHARK